MKPAICRRTPDELAEHWAFLANMAFRRYPKSTLTKCVLKFAQALNGLPLLVTDAREFAESIGQMIVPTHYLAYLFILYQRSGHFGFSKPGYDEPQFDRMFNEVFDEFEKEHE